LGGTIANWAFVWFMVVALLSAWMLLRQRRRADGSAGLNG